MSIADLLDHAAMAQLRALRRDRTLTIAGGSRSVAAHLSEETDELLTEQIVWIDLNRKQILGGCSATADEREEALVGSLIVAILDPGEGVEPQLPKRVVIEEASVAERIRPALRRLDVDVIVKPIPELDDIVAVFEDAYQGEPKWRMYTAAALPVYQAAASLWAAEPWDMLIGEYPSALLELPGEPPRAVYALAAGFDDEDETGFVAFHLSREDYERGRENEFEDDERTDDDAEAGVRSFTHGADALWVVFSSGDGLPEEALDFVELRRLPIGSASAYPFLLRSEPADDPHPPSDEDAGMLTLAMEALARFCLHNRLALLRDEGSVSAEVLVPQAESFVRVRVVSPVPER